MVSSAVTFQISTLPRNQHFLKIACLGICLHFLQKNQNKVQNFRQFVIEIAVLKQSHTQKE